MDASEFAAMDARPLLRRNQVSSTKAIAPPRSKMIRSKAEGDMNAPFRPARVQQASPIKVRGADPVDGLGIWKGIPRPRALVYGCAVASQRSPEDRTSLEHSADPVAQTTPPDGCQRTDVVDAAFGIVRVVDEHRCTTKIRARHGSVVPAIDGVIAVVAHHEEGAAWYDERSPLVEAWSRYRRAESRAANFDLMLPRKNRLWLVRERIRKHERVA